MNTSEISAALKRAAKLATTGSKEQRSGRFLLRDTRTDRFHSLKRETSKAGKK
ncbi:MAG: hypothetical protein KJ622_17195 [Alphaproteobacteria bacterium]|nr:hypothetical protein [Alphaproteobacteria bacterium]